ncbi:phage tail tape measure protein [Arthrobacter sp. CP30]
MATRSVIVRLQAEVGQYIANMQKAAQSTEQLAKRAVRSGQEQRQALDQVGQAATVAGAVTLAGVGLAVKTYADFDKQMSKVGAATHETEENMAALGDAAVRAGAETAFSAEEAAKGIEEMAKAGVSTKDILGGGLNGALALAAAGSLGVGEAAELAATAMTQFGLSGEDIPRIADLLAAGAGKAQGSVQDMGEALKQAGLVADQTGLTIEETTGGLAAFASAGLVGSDAGTSFKSMLQRLNPSSKEAKDLMSELGISAYDAQGNFIGLSEFAGNLQTSMKDLTVEQRNAALSTIFGSDAIRAASVLYENGAAGVEKWEEAVSDAGYAAETAAIMQDNLAGDLEKLGGAIDTVFLKSGSGANDFLRGGIQQVEGFVDAIGKIPTPVLTGVTAVAGLTGGALLLGGAFITAIPRIADTVSAIGELRSSSPRATTAIGKLGAAAGIATVALVGLEVASKLAGTGLDDIGSSTEFETAIRQLSQDADAGAESLNELSTASGSSLTSVDGLGAALETVDLNGFLKTLDFVGSGFGVFDTEVGLAEGVLSKFDDALTGLVSSGNLEQAADGFRQAVAEGERVGKTMDVVAESFPGYIDGLRELSNTAGVTLTDQELLNWAMGETPAAMDAASAAAEGAANGIGTLSDAAGQAAPITEEMADRLEDVGLTAEGTIISLSKYTEALFAAGLAQLSSRDASRAFQESIDAIAPGIEGLVATYGGLGDVLNETGTDFNDQTDAGREAGAMFDSIASSGLAYTQSLADAGAGQDELTASMQSTYDALIVAFGQFGVTGTAAEDLASKIMTIPPGVDIQTYFSDQAILMAAETTGAVDAIPKDVQIRSAMSAAAKETADATKKSAEDIPNQETIDSWMSDAAFMEAIRTRAAALNIPESEAIASFMSSAARNEADNTTSAILGIPAGASVTSFMDAYARDMAYQTRDAVNSIPTNKVVTITTRNERVGVGQNGLNAFGGRLPAHYDGGRLPTTGPGTERQDGILGISSMTGAPTTWVDAGEHITRRSMTEKHSGLLWAIHRDDPRLSALPAFADGGRLGRDYTPGGTGMGAPLIAQHTHHHTHVSADPGLGHEYASRMATIGEQRSRDMAAAYGNRRN